MTSDPRPVAFVDLNLHLPKTSVNVAAIKSALTWRIEGAEKPTRIWSETDDYITVPRAFGNIVVDGGASWGLQLVHRGPTDYAKVAFQDSIVLDAQGTAGVQQAAFDALQTGRDGTLELYCGAGKTIVAFKHVVKVGRPALAVVDNDMLLQQWHRQASTHMKVPGGVAIWKGSNRPLPQSAFTVTTYQTLARRASLRLLTPEEQAWPGVILFDEGHHIGTPAFHHVASAFHGQRISLSATPARANGLHHITQHAIGGTLFSSLKPPLIPRILFLKMPTYLVEEVREGERQDQQFALLGAALASNPYRMAHLDKVLNGMVFGEERCVRVLTRSLLALTNMMSQWLENRIHLTPSSPDKEREKELARLLGKAKHVGALAYEVPPHVREEMLERPLLFSIAKYGREGLDNPKADTVVLHEPMVDEGLLQQVMGRPTRIYPGKKHPLVVVIVDDVSVFKSAARTMQRLLRNWPACKGGPLRYEVVSL